MYSKASPFPQKCAVCRCTHGTQKCTYGIFNNSWGRYMWFVTAPNHPTGKQKDLFVFVLVSSLDGRFVIILMSDLTLFLLNHFHLLHYGHYWILVGVKALIVLQVALWSRRSRKHQISAVPTGGYTRGREKWRTTMTCCVSVCMQCSVLGQKQKCRWCAQIQTLHDLSVVYGTNRKIRSILRLLWGWGYVCKKE